MHVKVNCNMTILRQYISKEYAQTMKKGKINGYELLVYKDGCKPGYFIPNFTIFGEGFPFSEMYINEHVFILDLMDNAIHYEPIKFNWRKDCNPRHKYKRY